MEYVLDIETNIYEYNCECYLIGAVDFETESYFESKDWDNFFNLTVYENSTFWVHNLRFDGVYLMYWLFEKGYKFNNVKTSQLRKNEFKTIINAMGMYYTIIFKYKKYIITFKDSAKIIPLKVSQIGKAFGYQDMNKGIYDYEKIRTYENLTVEDKEYNKQDNLIVVKAIKKLKEQGLTANTQAGNGLKDFKQTITSKLYNYHYNYQNYDDEIRKAYYGGLVLVKKGIENKDIGKGFVYDENSAYPYVLKNCRLPFYEPIKCEGKYKYDKQYNLYIQNIDVMFTLKKGYLPFISVKDNALFKTTEHIEDTKGEIINLSLTNIDYKNLFKHYNILYIKHNYYIKFMSKKGLFDKYVDKWYDIKKKAGKENPALRTIAKFMLNALTGKFAKKIHNGMKEPYLSDDNIIKFKNYTEETKGLYCALSAFITAYARDRLLKTAQDNYQNFLYCDTDSLHLTDIIKNANVGKELGDWDLEFEFKRARYIRAKCYIEENDTETIVKCAGMSDELKKKINYDNFKIGLELSGKKVLKIIEKGCILHETTFKIKNI